MATIGGAKATLVNKIDSLTASATAKDTIYLAKALKENTNHHSFTFQGAWAATTAYALDDVVTNGGNTYICIAAHTSGASFSVGSNWTMMAAAGSTVGTGTAGQVLKTNSAGTGIEWGADEGGKLLQVLEVTDGTRVGLPTGSSWSRQVGSFTKLSATSDLFISVHIPGDGNYSDNCGVFVQLDSNSSPSNNTHAYRGISYVSSLGHTNAIRGQQKWSGKAAGLHTLHWGWKTINGSSGDRPFNVLNSNNSDDVREQQHHSTFIIMEVEV